MLGETQLDLARNIAAERTEMMIAERPSRDSGHHRKRSPRLRQAVGAGLIRLGLRIVAAPPQRPQTSPPC